MVMGRQAVMVHHVMVAVKQAAERGQQSQQENAEKNIEEKEKGEKEKNVLKHKPPHITDQTSTYVDYKYCALLHVSGYHQR